MRGLSGSLVVHSEMLGHPDRTERSVVLAIIKRKSTIERLMFR